MQPTRRTLTACCVAALGFAALGYAALASADEPLDVVQGPGRQPIHDAKFGTCVQTKWNAKEDVCAPATAPKRVEVVAPPPPPPAPEPVSKLAHEQLTIYFPFNKDTLTPESKSKLDTIAEAVNHPPKVTKIDIVGYTDQIGSNSYNNRLSVRRANSAKAYLDTKTHIDTGVLGLRGKGKEDPVVDCSKAKGRQAKIDCMAKDRRVEIEFEYQQ